MVQSQQGFCCVIFCGSFPHFLTMQAVWYLLTKFFFVSEQKSISVYNFEHWLIFFKSNRIYLTVVEHRNFNTLCLSGKEKPNLITSVWPSSVCQGIWKLVIIRVKSPTAKPAGHLSDSTSESYLVQVWLLKNEVETPKREPEKGSRKTLSLKLCPSLYLT